MEKRNTGKKTPKEDHELGYLDFTLALTFYLIHPQQKDMQLSPMHEKLKYDSGRWSKQGVQSADDHQVGGFNSPEPTTSIVLTPSVVSSLATTLILHAS